MKKKTDKNKSREIKEKIWEMLQNGSSQSAAARATGTTRQYVHLLAKDFATRGFERVEASQGRPFDEPLSPGENRLMFETLLNKTPREAGIDADAWSRTPLQEWFKKEFGRHLSRNQVRRFCTENEIDIEPERSGYLWIDENFDKLKSGAPKRKYQAKKDPKPTGESSLRKTDPSPKKRPVTKKITPKAVLEKEPASPRRGRPPRGQSEMDLEAIQKSVEETQKKLSQKQIDSLYGKKRGKHSKGKKTPFTPSRKKKKKKKK